MGLNNNHGGNIYEAARKYCLREEEILDFSSNINPLGISNKVFRALKDNLKDVVKYPDSDSAKLREAIGKYHSINPENIIVGNGATELIHYIPRMLISKKVLIPVPTFSEYEAASIASGAKVKYLRLKEDSGFGLDEKALNKALNSVDMFFLCNPNNPTGQLLPKKSVIKIADSAEKRGVVIVLDEVFIDYNEKESLISDAVKIKNLIVLRAFTKFFAMPGLRLGYLAANSLLIKRLNERRPPWPVNSLAQAAGIISLSDKAYIKDGISYVKKESGFLLKELSKIDGLLPFPSSTNFILVKIKNDGINVKKLYNILAKKGILIRDCSNFALSERFFRIAVKKRDKNKRLLNELRNIFAEY